MPPMPWQTSAAVFLPGIRGDVREWRTNGHGNNTQKIMLFFVKKCLTNRRQSGNISKLSTRAAKNMPKEKKFEKT